MLRTGALRFRREARLSVQASLEDGFQTSIGTSLCCQGVSTGRFQSRVGIGLGQAENAQTGAIAHLRMRFAVQDGAGDLGRGLAHALSPVNQPRGGPLQMSLVAPGSMLVHGGVVVGGEAAYVRRHAFSALEDLYSVISGTYFQLLV